MGIGGIGRAPGPCVIAARCFAFLRVLAPSSANSIIAAQVCPKHRARARVYKAIHEENPNQKLTMISVVASANLASATAKTSP